MRGVLTESVTLYDYYICDLISANAIIGNPNVDGAI